nr:hypothetical protein [Tanacetum cinerariifolium]
RYQGNRVYRRHHAGCGHDNLSHCLRHRGHRRAALAHPRLAADQPVCAELATGGLLRPQLLANPKRAPAPPARAATAAGHTRRATGTPGGGAGYAGRGAGRVPEPDDLGWMTVFRQTV